MISAVVLLDRAGEILAMRKYRKDFNMVALDNSTKPDVAAKEVNSP